MEARNLARTSCTLLAEGQVGPTSLHLAFPTCTKVAVPKALSQLTLRPRFKTGGLTAKARFQCPGIVTGS